MLDTTMKLKGASAASAWARRRRSASSPAATAAQAVAAQRLMSGAPAAVTGQIDRKAFLAERGLDLGEQAGQIDVFRVDPGDDDHGDPGDQSGGGGGTRLMAEEAAGPLSGLRVLELGSLIAGPFATRTLADLGAEVIKVETPRLGDYARIVPETLGGDAMYRMINRGKRSIAVNYRNRQGREIFLKLARSADVIVETAQDVVAAIDHGHIRAEAGKDACEFQRDIAAAHHDRAPRQALDVADHSARCLFDTLPIHASMRELDEEVVYGAVRFRMIAVSQEMERRLDAARLAAALLSGQNATL